MGLKKENQLELFVKSGLINMLDYVRNEIDNEGSM